MLQSEFYERTGINLTGDDYARVEQMYLATQMDKDVFCKEWLKHRDDRIVRELMGTVNALQMELNKANEDIKEYTQKIDNIESQCEKKHQDIVKTNKMRFEDFARSIIDGLEDIDVQKVYDTIEEEFGIAFIIKYKRSRGYELSESEIDYMVSKL